MSVMVMVYCTTEPGVVVAVLAVLVMVRAGISTVTVVVQAAGAGPEAGQLAPGVAEVTVAVRVAPPVPGLSTVTVKVIVAAAPTARSPVQVRSGAA